jgi:SAM-dependent methyltransferase
MILDVGCLGFTQRKLALSLGRADTMHFGVDYCARVEVPDGFVFKRADLDQEGIPFPDDSFDLVVATHTIEHLRRPVEFFGECMRVCRPGGFAYFSGPSERSLWIPSYPLRPKQHVTLSFYDDPTHCGRPFTPQGFVRLARTYGCEPVRAGYDVSWPCRLGFPVLFPLAVLLGKRWLLEKVVWGSVGWVCSAIVRKPPHIAGPPPFEYDIPSLLAPDDAVYRALHWLARAVGVVRMSDGSPCRERTGER